MPTDALPSIGFIGAGRLAAALAAGLQSAGYRVTHIASRDAESAAVLAGFLGADTVTVSSPQEVADACAIVFLAVPDSAITQVCSGIQWAPRHHVLHCSGALGLDVLAPVAAVNGTTGCLHPLQTFPSRAPQPERFANIYCGIEGRATPGFDPAEAAVQIGATPVRLEGVDRAAYHAAAVFMSNYVIALGVAATRLWELAGLPAESARPALAPLVLAAAANVANMELPQALTGPIARGDTATVDGHLRALAGQPDLERLYRQLGLELLALPLRHDAATAAELRRLLETGHSD